MESKPPRLFDGCVGAMGPRKRCIFGCSDCPECEARSKDKPAGAESFASTPSSSSQPASVGLFGQQATAASLFTYSSPTRRQSFTFGTPALGSSPVFGSPSPIFNPEPPTEQLSPCSSCHGAICRGQATVTSECNHRFHLRCFSGSVCPVCGARWREQGIASPSPFRTPFATSPPHNTFSNQQVHPFGTSPPHNPFTNHQVQGGPPFSRRSPAPRFTFTTPNPAPPTPPSPLPSSRSLNPPAPVFSFNRPNPHPTPPSPSPSSPSFTSPPPILFSTLTPSPFSSPQPPCFTCTAPKPHPTPPPSPPSIFARSINKFVDDDPVKPPLEGWEIVPEVANNGLLVLKTHGEVPVVARDADKFKVLVVHAKAPVVPIDASRRVPFDLVAVLDFSESMDGSNLALLKQTMGFVIDKLGPRDRLSIVLLSCDSARRATRLTQMSGSGKASAKGAVEPRKAVGTKSIAEGLRIASQVLSDRRYKNPASSVLLFSDGLDNLTDQSTREGGCFGRSSCAKSFVDLVPPSLRRGDGRTPIHTFGFGRDHNERAMRGIAEVSGGMFSFIQNQAVMQDWFKKHMNGPAVQEARIKVKCLYPGVRVGAVTSHCRCKSNIDADGRTALVDIGELYSEGESSFLLLVDVPIAARDDGDVTQASCTYKDAATGQSVEVVSVDAVVHRPAFVMEDMEED